jgi:asparagine synthase (glutamine-hydrolysing)
MLGMIRHRGPDAFGIYTDSLAGLAHARLSIIDLSGGDQPIHNEDRSIWIVYNGEAFNYPELREELEDRGHRFYTRTDTEVLVHLYEEHGMDFLGKLNGQFALALWEKPRKRLLLARDRLGIRPLFYHLSGRRLLFGSEIKAIFADSRVPRRLDRNTIADIFTCWAPLGADTAFEGIRQLEPGHFALFSEDGLTTHRYWELSFSNPGSEERLLDDYIEELKSLLHDATRIRLRADVPVGAYLSGGLDSTFITSLVKRYFNNQLRTFSVSFTDGRFDEAPFQEKAVRALDTDHRRIRCTESDIGENFPRVVWHSEVPLLRTAPVPLCRLAELVRGNDFKVVLTGEGSDEIFAGYDIFKEDKVRRFWARQPDSKWRPRLFQRLYPDIFSGADNRGGTFLEGFFRKGLENVSSPAYSHFIRWENTSYLRNFFSSEVLEALGRQDGFVDRYCADLPADFMTWDPLSRAQYTEITVFLSNYLLSSQGDRVAMAHAVEGRFPFLDYRVVEFAARLPARYRMHGLRDKFILRKVAGEIIPKELSERPKQPYRAPIGRCFSEGEAFKFTEDLLSPDSIRESGYFDPSRVTRFMSKCFKHGGQILSERENMALAGIVSTQLLHHFFVAEFSSQHCQEPERLLAFSS